MMIDNISDKQSNKILQDLAHFIALYEQTEEKFKARTEEMNQQISTLKQETASQIEGIRQVLNEMKEVMTVAGAARWRVAAEKVVQQGEDHLTAIKEACNIYNNLAAESTSRLEHTADITEKRVNSALHHLNEENSSVVENFRRKAESSYEALQATTSDTINSIKRLLRWLQFDRVATAVIAALLSAFVVSLYINAEWPWESFHRAEKERLVGQTILSVWPTLSADKQKQITALLGRNI